MLQLLCEKRNSNGLIMSGTGLVEMFACGKSAHCKIWSNLFSVELLRLFEQNNCPVSFFFPEVGKYKCETLSFSYFNTAACQEHQAAPIGRSVQLKSMMSLIRLQTLLFISCVHLCSSAASWDPLHLLSMFSFSWLLRYQIWKECMCFWPPGQPDSSI